MRIFRDGWLNRGRVWHADDRRPDEHHYQAIALCGVRLVSHARFADGAPTCKRCLRARERGLLREEAE